MFYFRVSLGAADREVEVVLKRIQQNLSGVTILGDALYYTDNKGNLYKLQNDKVRLSRIATVVTI